MCELSDRRGQKCCLFCDLVPGLYSGFKEAKSERPKGKGAFNNYVDKMGGGGTVCSNGLYADI